MSSQIIGEKQLLCTLNSEKWYLNCLAGLYGLRQLGHSESTVYLMVDVESALIAHSADGRPTKAEMEKRIKAKANEAD